MICYSTWFALCLFSTERSLLIFCSVRASLGFAWRIPGIGEPGGLLSMGSHRVRHDWSDLAAAAAAAAAAAGFDPSLCPLCRLSLSSTVLEQDFFYLLACKSLDLSQQEKYFQNSQYQQQPFYVVQSAKNRICPQWMPLHNCLTAYVTLPLQT